MGSNANNSILHKEIYDELAEEYERRVDSLMPVTESAISYFSAYIIDHVDEKERNKALFGRFDKIEDESKKTGGD